MPRLLSLLLLCAVLFTTGCSLLPRRKQEPPAAETGPQRLGTVALVNREVGFLLIDLEVLYSPPAGLALKTFQPDAQLNEEGETGVLAVSPEQKRPFAVADIVSGSPQRGDVVYR